MLEWPSSGGANRGSLPKAIVFTMLVPVALATVICAAISFRLMPSGLWRIGPVIGVNWNGGAQARAMETRDVHTVTQHVYLDAVRVSLTNQVIARC